MSKSIKYFFFVCSLLSPRVYAVAFESQIRTLETEFDGYVGVHAVNTGTGKILQYRSDERFPLCSSFKGFLAAAILKKSQQEEGLLAENVRYIGREMEHHSPITKQYQSTGLSVSAMSAATVQYSDNGAANMLMERYIEGPKGLTTFMRGIGDNEFRLDRWELELNSAIPGDERDTSTPKAVAESLQKIALGSVLQQPQKKIFQQWLIGNTTGDARIRAAVPKEWKVGDKTGTCGVYGTANDYAIVWPDKSEPLVIAIYTKSKEKHKKHSDKLISEVAGIVIKNLK
ncbi:Carbapenem-hydrolyzing beta-lactamase Sme-1 precursor [Aeromonas salmonicida]|uniref:carbapenem-hydrolyzing class A beta-lactamase n=1 Tax=Aeromonas salmonicida TaxID=645 RepID=UPI001024A3DA|nr:Carbapenem-hydrolyzing beta-lactamase Sme-1 precursor [Aeromonas salmonicida]